MALTGVLIVLSLLLLLKGRRQESPAGEQRLKRFLPGVEEALDLEGGGVLRHPSRAFWRLLELAYLILPSRLRKVVAGGLDVPDHTGYTQERLAGIRVCATLFLPLGSAFALKFSKASLVLASPLMAAGFFLPLLLCRRGQARYFEDVRRALPDTADVLYALVLGGKNLDQAFAGAAVESAEPLRSVMMQAASEVRLAAPRAEAFERLRARCPVPELSSLLKTLLQAEGRGYPPSEALKVFSSEIRLRQRDRLRLEVAKAPLKMLAPLVFLILPAAVLLSVGPTFLATMRNIL